MPNSKTIGFCEMCEKKKELTFHHLIPKSTHKNKWFKKNFTKDEMTLSGINVCRQCHNFIHKTYTEKDLGRHFNTKEKILSDEKISKFVEWARKH